MRLVWLSLTLSCALFPAGCAPYEAPVYLVALPTDGLSLGSSQADLDEIWLEGCDGEHTGATVDAPIDLRVGGAVILPVGDACGVGLAFGDVPDGGLQVAGTTAGGADFDIGLDPGLVLHEQLITWQQDDGVIALDLGLLLDPDALEQSGADVAYNPEDPDAVLMAARTDEAIWFGTRQDAASRWPDLWPDINVEIDLIDIEVQGGGCGNRGGGGSSGGGAGGSGGGAADSGSEGGGSESGGSSGGGSSGGGSEGGSSGGGSEGGASGGGEIGGGEGGGSGGSSGDSGCGSSGGSGCGSSSGSGGCGSSSGSGGCGDCSGAACATVNIAPGGWALAVLLAWRRRRRPDRGAPT